MLTVPDIIAKLNGATAFGRICGFLRNPGARGHDMKMRQSIPVRYWPKVIAAARELNQPEITHETLTNAHTRVKRKKSSVSAHDDPRPSAEKAA